MHKITEVRRLKFEAKLTHDQVARAAGLSEGVVGKYISLAKAQGLSWPLPEGMDEVALESRLYPPREGSTRFAVPDHARIHAELKRKGVTLQLLWSEYVAEAGARAYRYTQFCEHYRQWTKRQKRSMRQVHPAGEKLFIDYCGPTVPIVNAATGELRQSRVFVAVLGASSYTYAEATWTQELPQWIASYQRAFRFFGGVAQLLVPDKPKDKSKAEIGVQVVKRQLKDLPHPEHGYRHCLGLLSHARRYGKERLEAASERALAIHSPSYRSVSSILKQGLDRQSLTEEEPEQGELPLHANVRGPGYYH